MEDLTSGGGNYLYVIKSNVGYNSNYCGSAGGVPGCLLGGVHQHGHFQPSPPTPPVGQLFTGVECRGGVFVLDQDDLLAPLEGGVRLRHSLKKQS